MSVRVTIHFQTVDLNHHAFGPDSMVSVVHFDAEVAGKTWPDQTVEVKLTAGADFMADKGTVEVMGQPEYDGPKNYDGFRHCAETYYREAAIGSPKAVFNPGATLSGITFDIGGTGGTFTFAKSQDCTYEAPE